MGTRSLGMANASSCLEDEWSLMNNPAGLSRVENTSASFAYHAYATVKSFNRMSMVFAQPFKHGVAALGVYRFGDALYNEQILSAGFGSKFGLASLGVRVCYLQYNAEGFGRTGAFTASMGGIATLTNQLMIGAHITNINQPKLGSEDEGEKVPTRLSAGIAFKPSNKVMLCTEVEKELGKRSLWKAGVDYQFHEKFLFRTGVNLNPNAAFLGIGCKPKKFELGYALQYNINLGLSHQASVAYRFNTK